MVRPPCALILVAALAMAFLTVVVQGQLEGGVPGFRTDEFSHLQDDREGEESEGLKVFDVTWDELLSSPEDIVRRTLELNAIARVTVDRSVDYAYEISKIRVPLLLRNTHADSWAASSLWTPEYLSQHVDMLYAVYTAEDPEFYYYNKNKPMFGMPGVSLPHASETIDMKTSEFFETIARGEEDQGKPTKYVYYSGNVKLFGEELASQVDAKPFVVAAAVHDLDSILKYPEGVEVDTSDVTVTATAWFGGPKVTATAHYDGAYNFYHQIGGVKRFLLYAPAAHWNLYLHPVHHPRYRQSQAPFGDRGPGRFSRAQYVRYLTVDLEPGDTLYMPPYWFHRVSALTASLSVNIWSDCRELLLFERILSAAVPLEGGEADREAAVVFLDALVDAVLSLPFVEEEEGGAVVGKASSKGSLLGGPGELAATRTHPRTFIARLLFTRYDAIFPNLHAEGSLPGSPCLSQGPAPFGPDGQRTSSDDRSVLTTLGSQKQAAALARVHRGIAPLLRAFAELPDDGIRSILLANYIEVFASHVVGGRVGEVGPLLHSCWRA